MPDDDRNAMNALDRALDRLVKGEPAPPTAEGIDPGLAMAAANFRRQFLGDPAASPSPEFLRRLEQQLMAQAERVRPIGQERLAAREPLPTIAPVAFQRTQPRSSARTALAAAAILLLTLAADFGAFRLRPDSAPGHHGSNPGFAISSSPSAVATATTSANSCDPALPSSTIPAIAWTASTAAATAEPTGTADLSEAAYQAMLATVESAMDQGQPADAATARAVTETVDELFACMRADDAGRTHALFTDDYWRRHGNHGFSESSQLGPNKPDGFHPDPQTPAVGNVRLLPDGRVGAVLSASATATLHAGMAEAYMFFVHVGDRWLIDDAVVIPGPPLIQISVTDNGFTPSTITVFGQVADISLRDTGAKPHSLVIPELGIRLEAAPHQSAFGTLQASPGRYQFTSDLPGDNAAGFSGMLTIATHATPTAGTPAT